MVDGIDGSGKRTIVEAMRGALEAQGRVSFDIGEWSKTHHTLPELSDMAHAEVIIGVEPSYAWTGSAIRDEMVRSGKPYTSRQIAEAFSTDRLTIYARCYLPLLERGAIIIAERGVSSSIAYQPAADPTLLLEDVLAMSGNTFALTHRPDHLIIATLDAHVAMQRLNKRTNKQDGATFEQEAFLHQLDERYRSKWFANIFTSRGTTIHQIDTTPTIEEVRASAINLLQSFI